MPSLRDKARILAVGTALALGVDQALDTSALQHPSFSESITFDEPSVEVPSHVPYVQPYRDWFRELLFRGERPNRTPYAWAMPQHQVQMAHLPQLDMETIAMWGEEEWEERKARQISSSIAFH